MDNRDLETVERLIVDLEFEKLKRYSPEELQIFTSNFSKELGSGSFGKVYKGILHNGVQVAVKVLKDGVLSDTVKDQFMAEVSTVGKTHHRNLVKLYGFCFAPNVKALVYEFMENESLEKILYERGSIMWETLCDIVIGTANGLSYLHKDCEPGIIHYDIKPSNILLDSKFCPKVGDFGLAKVLTTDKSHVTTSGFRGTPYYGAPELWMRSSSATYKCDVYSYGIMLFEILGRRRFDGQKKSFMEQVWEKFKQGKLEELMQGCGIEEKNTEHAKRIFIVALLCVQYRPQDRPSMSDVVRLLEGREEVVTPPNPFWPLEYSSTMTRPNIELEENEKEVELKVGMDGEQPIKKNTKAIEEVCKWLRDGWWSDYLWERHMKKKWGGVIGQAAYREWKWKYSLRKEFYQKKKKGWLRSLSFVCSTSLPMDSIISWYLCLESGKLWFPAQVYNRENGHVQYMLSCYDAELRYDCFTNTFQARYSSHYSRAPVIEECVHWDRIRAPPIDIPPHNVHASDCLDKLRPGDHVEIQWRGNKELPYGWWYGVVGHLETCDKIRSLCRCHKSDTFIVVFNQYSPGSPWRQTTLSRKDHQEVGGEAEGFYGGIRKLDKKEEICVWKHLWPKDLLP